ncbi:MAG: hypothetical protein CL512_03840 [Actinobacteria bacterium]|nr:hypothetical protein [Actinomycetota bacterium]|tara:strand:- start:631 stop:942 length:312 start_codon:yes stop_codon:yes gene_type:complete
MQKFIAVPWKIQEDVIKGDLIGTDLMIFMYLASKAGHGRRIFTSRESMQEELGGVSLSKVADSLGRLAKAGHIERQRLNGVTSTKLLTFVKNANNIYIKGVSK